MRAAVSGAGHAARRAGASGHVRGGGTCPHCAGSGEARLGEDRHRRKPGSAGHARRGWAAFARASASPRAIPPGTARVRRAPGLSGPPRNFIARAMLQARTGSAISAATALQALRREPRGAPPGLDRAERLLRRLPSHDHGDCRQSGAARPRGPGGASAVRSLSRKRVSTCAAGSDWSGIDASPCVDRQVGAWPAGQQYAPLPGSWTKSAL